MIGISDQFVQLAEHSIGLFRILGALAAVGAWVTTPILIKH